MSALSLGPHGWIQVANFVGVGVCFLLFSKAASSQFPEGKASRGGPLLLTIVGICLVGSGPFVMDPAGTPFPRMTAHGQVHAILGAVVFSLGPASTFVFFRRFRVDPNCGGPLEDRDRSRAGIPGRIERVGGSASALRFDPPDGLDRGPRATHSSGGCVR